MDKCIVLTHESNPLFPTVTAAPFAWCQWTFDARASLEQSLVTAMMGGLANYPWYSFREVATPRFLEYRVTLDIPLSKPMDFADKLASAIEHNQSLLCVGLDPDPNLLPECYDQSDDLYANLWAWMQGIITQTATLACAYKPTLGFYEALGVEGFVLLEKVLTAIPSAIPVILDAKHGDPATSAVFARQIFEVWGVDAVTLMPYGGQDHTAPFLTYPTKAVFILCQTPDFSAAVIQDYPLPENPLYLHIVREVKTWGSPEQLALEIGATRLDALARVRELAPERVILARGLWREGGDLTQTLQAGLKTSGDGLLIPVPHSMLSGPNAIQKVNMLREKVNQERERITAANTTCSVWLPDICLLRTQPYLDLVLQLYDLGCIMFGDYVQASGATFPYYVDLRNVISNPQVFQKMLSAYADILKKLDFDRIAGIPYGSLPTAAGLALRLHRPMIFPRKEVKAHGTKKVVEGAFEIGEKIVVVDDILITGRSVIEGAEKLKSVGLLVKDIVVFIDHEHGVKDAVSQQGYQAHAVLTITDIIDLLDQAGRLTEAQLEILRAKH